MVHIINLITVAFFAYSANAEFELHSSFREAGKGFPELYTCEDGVSSFTYDYKLPSQPTSSQRYYDVLCGYPPATGSIMLCSVYLKNSSNTDQFVTVLSKELSKICSKYSSYHYSSEFYENQYLNATQYYLPLNEINNISLPLYYPTIPNPKTFTYYDYYYSYFWNIDSGTWFSAGIIGYFALLILIASIYNFSREIPLAKKLNNSKFLKLCQAYVIFPTLFPKGKFSEAYSWKFFSILIPNRIQFITDLFLFVLQVGFYSADYKYDDKTYKVRFIADRTGIMAFGKIPLLILFAGRNNFLLWLTGWSYATFLHFHKMLAYWMFLDAIIHSVAYTIYVLGYYVEDLKETYFACGVAATVLGGVIIGQSLYPFRKLSYEVFLVLHVILAIAFIIMCWYHCNILGWMEWLIAACCVWFFDRLVRVIRMAGFGFRQASLTVVGDNLFKIEVEKPSWVSHTPGHYYYIYFAGWNFWQNHPFTTVQEGNKLCTYVRVKTGMTKRIFNTLSQNGGKMQWKVCYEGPYGGDCAQKFKKYDDSLLIAGGSGVPGVLDSATRVNTGKMVWVVQTLASVNAYRPLLENIHADLDIFVTRESGTDRECSLGSLLDNNDLDDNSSSKDSSKELEDEKVVAFKTNTVAVTVNYGRPDIQQMVTEYVTNSPSPNVGILACGPPQLMDNLRHVISKNVTNWDKSIDFFDEFQIW
jgi:ferric-chelate reductase